MLIKFGTDTFVYDNTFEEDLKTTDFFIGNYTKEEKKDGLYFLPDTSLTDAEFEEAGAIPEASFCVTMIYTSGHHNAWSNMTFEETNALIAKKKSKAKGEDYILVFNIADAKKIYDYFPDEEKKSFDEEGSRFVSFSICLRGGKRYDHSTLVPNSITDSNELQEFIIKEMLGDKVWIEIQSDEIDE